MDKFKNLSIRMKILIGIGLNFLVIMAMLLGVVFFQYSNLSSDSKQLLEEELLNREQEKVKDLVEIRAKMISQIHLKNKDKLSTTQLKKLIRELNNQANLEGNYFYIYSFEGETISLPPTPDLEGTNRWDLEVAGRNLVQEMSQLAQEGGGQINYQYTNPQTDELETKYGYVQPIEGTNFFIGTGSYQSNFNSIMNKINSKITDIRNETLYFLIAGFLLVMLIIFEVIYIISNYINEHINELITAFKQVINGRLDFKLEHENNDEFGKLISGFNYMIERISNLTYSDPLTGLPNMNFLENSLSSDLEKIGAEEHLYLFTLGISNFSLINSNYGYHLGNELLEQMFLRLDEIIDQDTTIARKSDEFIFYFRSRIEEDEVLDLGLEILEHLATPYNFDNKLVYAEPKLGIAEAKRGVTDCDGLIKKSELALHFTEHETTDLLLYNPQMKGELADRMNLESKLRNALDNQEFLLHYQPLVDTKEDNILGVEALIRWDHPQEGMISPGDFIPIAEDTGMIVDLGNWVLEEACQQLKAWQELGYDDLVMSVNIAPQQFQQTDFVQQLRVVLEETGIEPHHLELEITERTVIENVEYTIELLNQLKEIGVKIAIDDFGTGYSSLEYLNEFALDTLKIDRAFVHNKKNEALVKTIIMISDNLGLSVIAEGVETREELDFLVENECYVYQGYLYSRPIGAAEIIDLLEEN
ncbi:MAG: EAL domain-containing protein [Bacillota bacterium]